MLFHFQSIITPSPHHAVPPKPSLQLSAGEQARDRGTPCCSLGTGAGGASPTQSWHRRKWPPLPPMPANPTMMLDTTMLVLHRTFKKVVHWSRGCSPLHSKFIQDLYQRAAVAFPPLVSIQRSPYYPRKQDITALQPSFKQRHTPAPLQAPGPMLPVRRCMLPGGSSQVRACTEKDQAAYLGSSSYQSVVKLCGNKLLNGKECLQVNLQSTIKFPKSFNSAPSPE